MITCVQRYGRGRKRNEDRNRSVCNWCNIISMNCVHHCRVLPFEMIQFARCSRLESSFKCERIEDSVLYSVSCDNVRLDLWRNYPAQIINLSVVRLIGIYIRVAWKKLKTFHSLPILIIAFIGHRVQFYGVTSSFWTLLTWEKFLSFDWLRFLHFNSCFAFAVYFLFSSSFFQVNFDYLRKVWDTWKWSFWFGEIVDWLCLWIFVPMGNTGFKVELYREMKNEKEKKSEKNERIGSSWWVIIRRIFYDSSAAAKRNG